MDRYIVCEGTILTFDPENPVLEDHAILVENGIISQIRPKSELIKQRIDRIDATGCIVMPGLINAHHHFYSTLVRGLGKAAPSQDFNEVLTNLWWRLDRKLCLDDVYLSAQISIFDAIRQGCTTIIDHHASPGAVTGSLEMIAKAVRQSGIRASLCYEVSDRDGAQISRDGIGENIRWLQRLDSSPNPMLKGLFGLHAAFTLEDETLRIVSDYVQKTGCGIHVHAAEAKSDQDFNLKHHGKSVMQRFADFGLVNAKSIFAHGVHLSPQEMSIVAEHGAAIVTNPQSNLNNAVGIADICKMSELGVCVGLGTDAMTVNMLQELRVGLWAQHLKQDNPSMGFMELANTLTVNNPAIANKYFDKIGILKPGYAADIIIREYITPTPLDAGTWLGHLIYGISQSAVNTTICNGKILMRDRQMMIEPDEYIIASTAEELARELWERF